MNPCEIKDVLGFVGASGALLAAGFWFYASWVGRFTFTETPMGLVNRHLNAQARFNALAAFCAGIAALCQLTITYLPVCRAFG
jgi:hypothetical protein